MVDLRIFLWNIGRLLNDDSLAITLIDDTSYAVVVKIEVT